jgi:hypothetical protein
MSRQLGRFSKRHVPLRLDSPTPRRALGCLVVAGAIITGVVVLPLLLWMHTTANLVVAGVLLNQSGYARTTFQISEYGHWTEGAGEFMSTQHYFSGVIAGRPETMSVAFARYSPALSDIMDTATEGRTPLQLTIDVWYNPGIRRSILAREQAVLPYAPGLFSSLYARLGGYALLWLLFAGIWLTMILLPKLMRR